MPFNTSFQGAMNPKGSEGYLTFSQAIALFTTTNYIAYDPKLGAVRLQGYLSDGKKWLALNDVLPHDGDDSKRPENNVADFQEIVTDNDILLTTATISEFNKGKKDLEQAIKDANDAVTHAQNLKFDTANIEDGAVTHPKLALLAVESTNIKDGAITTDKIADQSITDACIDPAGISVISDSAISTRTIQDGAVNKDKMDLTGLKLTDFDPVGFIRDGDDIINDGSLSNQKLQDNTVTGAKIKDNTITEKELDFLFSEIKVVDYPATWTVDRNGRVRNIIPRSIITKDIGDAQVTKIKLAKDVTDVLDILTKDSTANEFVDTTIGRLAKKDTSAFHKGVDDIVATSAADTTSALHATVVNTVKDVLSDTTSSVSLVTKDVMDAEFASRDSSIYTIETDVGKLYQQDATLEAGINTLDTKIEDVKTANIADITNLQSRVRRNENTVDSHAIRITALENAPTASTVAKVFNFTGVTTTIGDEDMKVSDVFVVADTANNTSKAYRVKTATPKGSNLTTLIANSEVIEDAQIKFNREQHNLLKAEVNILKLDITTMQGSIQAQDNKIAAQDAKIAVLDSAVADIDSKAATALAESQANHNAILQVEQDTSINSQNIASQGATLGQHGSRLDTLDSTVSTQDTRITALESSPGGGGSASGTMVFTLDSVNNEYKCTLPKEEGVYDVCFPGNAQLTSSLVDFRYMMSPEGFGRVAKITNEIADLTAFEGLDLTTAEVELADGTSTNMADSKVGQAIDGYYFIIDTYDFKTAPNWPISTKKDVYTTQTGLTLKDNLFDFRFKLDGNIFTTYTTQSPALAIKDKIKVRDEKEIVSHIKISGGLHQVGYRFTQSATHLLFKSLTFETNKPEFPTDTPVIDATINKMTATKIYHRIGGNKNA